MEFSYPVDEHMDKRYESPAVNARKRHIAIILKEMGETHLSHTDLLQKDACVIELTAGGQLTIVGDDV